MGCDRFKEVSEKLADGGKAGGIHDHVCFGSVPYYQRGSVPCDVRISCFFADVAGLDCCASCGKDSESEENPDDELPFPTDLEFA